MSEKKPERRGLGRGLSALMADVRMGESGAEGGAEGGTPGRPDLFVGIDLLEPNPDQPRRDFPFDALAELSESVRRRGIIQPLIVRRHPGKAEHYQIVAGERRWRAAQMARLHEVPVLVRDFSDTEVIEVALIENIQRAELNAIEEAAAYRQLMERFGHTQEKLAEALSKSRSHIANLLRLLSLPPEVQDWLRAGSLTAGHARALVSTPDPTRLARTVIERGLSVRETEALARAATEPGRTKAEGERKRRAHPGKDADTLAIEADLSAHLRMQVRIEHQGIDGGRVSITYRSLDQLDRICQILSGMS
ncbi:MAG: ParB/RepB/Spo0J family partition protein [Paracoccaceae bacterium]